jgi:hypothetical protein
VSLLREVDDASLRPCPFCGMHALAVSYVTEAAVYCANPRCRATVTKRHLTQTAEDGLPVAIEAWNRRAPDPDARRQAISECAEAIRKLVAEYARRSDAYDGGFGSVDVDAIQRKAAQACAGICRALLTRPEEARGGDGEKA